MILSALTSIMGTRRTRYEKVAPDKFCFNHYITTEALTINHKSLYNAQTYAHLVPLMIDSRLAGAFFATNLWLNQYVYHFRPWQEVVHREIRPSQVLSYLRLGLEKLLDTTIGLTFENWTRQYQQSRIMANPATLESGGRVV